MNLRNLFFDSYDNENEGYEENEPMNDSQQDSIRYMTAYAPKDMKDAQRVCDDIIDGKTVVINLESVEYPLAQKIMDFISGAVYTLEGSIEKVSDHIFAIAPNEVEILSGSERSSLNSLLRVANK